MPDRSTADHCQVTRQPDADELADGISFAAARAKEVSFFGSTAPWSSLAGEHKLRMGTKNLAASLSEQLLAFIQEKWVIIHSSVRPGLRQADLPGFPHSSPRSTTGTKS